VSQLSSLLTTFKTRQKFREAYNIHLAALLERNEKQALLAKQSQRLLALLDDTPIVPGEEPRAFLGAEEGRAILNDAEAELREWTPSWEPHAANLASHQNHDQYIDTTTEQGQISGASHHGGASYAASNAATVGDHGAADAEQRMLEEERV
jgi:hypothetical protein